MVADGHQVTMVCAGEHSLKTEVSGIKIIRLAIPYRNAMSVPERLWSFARFMIAASVVAARTDADVIYASSTPLTVAVPAIAGRLARRIPMVFEVRDLWPSVPIQLGYLNNRFAVWLARVLERFAYYSSDRVVALSPGMRDGVLDVNPSKEVTVIPNSCDFELFSRDSAERQEFRRNQGWCDEEIVIVYAGSFGPVYELDWVTRLAAKVEKENIRFILFGEGKDSESLRELSLELGLDPKQLFRGKRPRAEIADYIAASDLVLSSVRNEPCLEAASINKIFDGMAAARPILANHGGWLTEAIVAGQAGWQLSRDLDRAAKQLRSIADDRESLVVAANNSAYLGRAHFGRDDLYQRLMRVLEKTARVSAPEDVKN